jgi:hypothetical protein
VSASAVYEIRVQGHLDGRWSTWFGGLTVEHDADGTTTLRGPVVDQAELHGLLAQVRDLGVVLLSVTVLDGPDRGPSTRSGDKGVVLPGNVRVEGPYPG